MRRTFTFVIAALAAASVIAPASPAAAGTARTPPPPGAVGAALYTNTIGEKLALAFIGGGTPTRAAGLVSFYNPTTRVWYIAVVRCYYQVGNTATMSGDIVLGELGERRIRLVVQDNGRTGDLVRITRRPIENPAFDCTRPQLPTRPVTRGDVIVSPTDSLAGARLATPEADVLPGDEDL